MGALDGKVALVTGGASGIGAATARRLAAEGARLCLVDMDRDGGEAMAKELDAEFLVADAGDNRDVHEVFNRCEERLGGVDVAFLNAGIAIGVSDIRELHHDVYRKIMRVNVDGVVYGTQAAVRAMERRGGGAIVATASLAGLVPFPPDPVYDATKHAVVGFIRSIAPTLRPLNITANTVNPGMTDTNILNAEAKALFKEAGFPLMPAEQIADAVFEIITTGRTGECWVCQPGRTSEPYRFHEVPGPRIEGAEGRRPPAVDPGRWATGGDA